MSTGELDPGPSHPHSTATENESKAKRSVLEGHGYVMGNTIGSGTYATVKVAWSSTHNVNVAVKIISKFTAPSDYLRKFLPREIEVVKGLRHANLIRFLQAIETTHRVYIIMEYAENGSLLDIIRKDTFIEEGRAKKWFIQLVDAVNYCHERNVVHRAKECSTYWFRDIKCENMLMDADYNLKLSDFGFARSQLKNANGQFVLSETFCGSYAYASPEILKGIPYLPHQADVWSCGVVLYAMVFGKLPFDDSNFATLLKQVSGKITFPREPKVSSSCKLLITKILSPLRHRINIPSILSDPWSTNIDNPTTSGYNTNVKTDLTTKVSQKNLPITKIDTVNNKNAKKTNSKTIRDV